MEQYSLKNTPTSRRNLSIHNNTFDKREENDSKLALNLHQRRRSSRMTQKIKNMKEFSEGKLVSKAYMPTHRENAVKVLIKQNLQLHNIPNSLTMSLSDENKFKQEILEINRENQELKDALLESNRT